MTPIGISNCSIIIIDKSFLFDPIDCNPLSFIFFSSSSFSNENSLFNLEEPFPFLDRRENFFFFFFGLFRWFPSLSLLSKRKNKIKSEQKRHNAERFFRLFPPHFSNVAMHSATRLFARVRSFVRRAFVVEEKSEAKLFFVSFKGRKRRAEKREGRETRERKNRLFALFFFKNFARVPKKQEKKKKTKNKKKREENTR